MYTEHPRQSLDPASLPPAGKASLLDGWVAEPKRWVPGDSMAKTRRRPGNWAATGEVEHIGALKTERDPPRLGPQAGAIRVPEYRYSVDDVPGAAPKPRPGVTHGPRVLTHGLSSTFYSTRRTDPCAPVYTLPSGTQTEARITSPRDLERAVFPTGGRNGPSVDKYPRARTLINPGSKGDHIGCNDINGEEERSAYGLKERSTLHPSIDYCDVFRSNPSPAAHDAGHRTVYSGKIKTFTVMPGPEGKRGYETMDTRKPPPRARLHTTNPLTPSYDYDPVGQLCRRKQMIDSYEHKHPERIAQRRSAGTPPGELLGRMEAYGAPPGKSNKVGPGKLSTMYQTRPFAPVSDWQR